MGRLPKWFRAAPCGPQKPPTWTIQNLKINDFNRLGSHSAPGRPRPPKQIEKIAHRKARKNIKKTRRSSEKMFFRKNGSIPSWNLLRNLNKFKNQQFNRAGR